MLQFFRTTSALVFFSTILSACSVESEQENQPTSPEKVINKHEELKAHGDYDGDLILNQDEVDNGTSPYLADLPKLRIRFLQNYKIIVKYKDLENEKQGEFVIDTKVHQDNPDFKYRVGSVFIRNESYKNAASVGRFSTHSWGEINEHDLSWVKYPEVDYRFYSKNMLKYREFFNPKKYEIVTINIELENSVRLKENRNFKSIKDLVLNFHYYDYEKEIFDQVKSVKIEKHFNAGVNEVFSVLIENVPPSLILENYFKRGEFIISELSDYDIPERKISYKKLLKSVRNKSIPFIFNTPLKSDVLYIGLNGKNESFTSILSKAFDKKYTIEANKLVKINQFRSNLPSYTYLSEIKELDKQGNWYVFTNKLNKHYLDYSFGPSDVLSLSYITGDKLASQASEKIFSFSSNVESADYGNIYPLGNITALSEINIQINPVKLWGERIVNIKDTIRSGGPCGKNCIPRRFTCELDGNAFKDVSEKLIFNNDYSGELERISLVINQDKFSLKSLIEEKKVEANWVEGNLHIRIYEIRNIKEIIEAEENVMSLSLTDFKDTTFRGIKLIGMTGPEAYYCPKVVVDIARNAKWPVSHASLKYNESKQYLNPTEQSWGTSKSYFRRFSIGISSVIKNMFN